MSTDAVPRGNIVDVVKVHQRKVICAVAGCSTIAFYDIHLVFPHHDAIPGVTVPMCRHHGDTAHPGRCESTP